MKSSSVNRRIKQDGADFCNYIQKASSHLVKGNIRQKLENVIRITQTLSKLCYNSKINCINKRFPIFWTSTFPYFGQSAATTTSKIGTRAVMTHVQNRKFPVWDIQILDISLLSTQRCQFFTSSELLALIGGGKYLTRFSEIDFQLDALLSSYYS